MKSLIIGLFLMPFAVKAQRDPSGAASMPTTAGMIMDARSISGKQIPTSAKLDIAGSPMLNDDFTNGTVKFKNEDNTYNLLLNLSLIDNQLYFKKDNETLMFVNAIEAFAINGITGDSTKMLYFKSGYPAIGSNSNQSFYQVLTAGSKLQLLRYTYKIIQEKSNYGGSHEREYLEKEKFYAYDEASKTMAVVTLSANAIKKVLPQYAAQIEKFVSQDKLKTMADVQLLFSAINNE